MFRANIFQIKFIGLETNFIKNETSFLFWLLLLNKNRFSKRFFYNMQEILLQIVSFMQHVCLSAEKLCQLGKIILFFIFSIVSPPQ